MNGNNEKEQLQLNKEKDKIIQLIIFHLDDEEFGIDIDQIREIIKINTITSIPTSPDFIAGITNVRGEIAVIIDLKKRFALALDKSETTKHKHIVIIEQAKTLFGLLVDEVTEVSRIVENEIKPVPKLVTEIDKAHIRGVLSNNNRLIIILDLKTILSEKELIQLSEFRTKHGQMKEKTEMEFSTVIK
jgi:purine-binding chemotaxis protein CheW